MIHKKPVSVLLLLLPKIKNGPLIICNVDMYGEEKGHFCKLQDEGSAPCLTKCQSFMMTAMM
jgi:hypothetical protein